VGRVRGESSTRWGRRRSRERWKNINMGHSGDVRDVKVKYKGDGTMDKERDQGQKVGDGEEVD
jgi:hypothetical protein